MGLSLKQFMECVLIESEQPVTPQELTDLIWNGKTYLNATVTNVTAHLGELVEEGKVVKASDGRYESVVKISDSPMK